MRSVKVLEVLLLGSVQAQQGDRAFAVNGVKQRALLARLAVARGRSVYREQLLADLWGETRPRNPVHALQAQVSRLRAALPVDIEFDGGGYSIDPAVFQTDAAQFESLCDQSGWLVADGAIASAAARLRAGLDLWRGPALADLPDVPALQAESVRLEKLRATALADRIDADLALGVTDAVVAELHALVRQQPYRERYWGQLMTALYGRGRSHEALDVFSRARRLFVDTLGVEPSGDLGHLHVKILRQEPPESLLRLGASSSARGSPLDHTGGRQDASREPLTSNRPGTLLALLRKHPAIVVTGPPGIGKSHLLRTVAASMQAQHRFAPILFANSLSKSIPLGAFLGIVDLESDDDLTPGRLVDYFVRRRSTAIVLVDDVDRLDDASLFVVTHLIRTAGIPALLTARDLATVPPEVQAMYDGGQLAHVAVDGLVDEDVDELAAQLLGGPLTPDARPRLHRLTGGNPLHLREIITGSLRDGSLVSTAHGWEFRGPPSPTSRLAGLLGERFDDLESAAVEAAARVAIAGEYPAEALGDVIRRDLARADVLAYTEPGWVRLAHPMDEGMLRARYPAAWWRELTVDVARVLRSDLARARPEARRRAQVLALDTGDEIDVSEALSLAEHALGSFDGRLALRVAETVLAQVSDAPRVPPQHRTGYESARQGPRSATAEATVLFSARRIAGQAAAALGDEIAAGTHFDAAGRYARTDAERAEIALTRAGLAGLRRHDAPAALAIIDEALGVVRAEAEIVHLQRERMRWSVVAGDGSGPGLADTGAPAAIPVEAATEISDTATAQGMITVGVAGVITGPLVDAQRMLFRLRNVPSELMDRVPGGSALVELTGIMALSNSGDVVSTRRRLEAMIASAQDHAPATLGMWEYALGFSHLLSGSATAALAMARAASDHLAWRDVAGLLPAAQALAGAAAAAAGRDRESRDLFTAIAPTAAQDPKVTMLRAWSEARQAFREGRAADASRVLVDGARWLLAAQHTYFAGMLAHCAVRIGGQPEPVASAAPGSVPLLASSSPVVSTAVTTTPTEAVAVIAEAHDRAGGGLLNLLMRHGDATVAGDARGLDDIAAEARELGIATTAADTWRTLLRGLYGDQLPESTKRRMRAMADEVCAETPGMALWAHEWAPGRPAS